MQLETFNPADRTEGDRLKPSEVTGHLLIVAVTGRKDSLFTEHSPDGAPGLVVNVIDLDADGGPAPYREVLWMNGAIVDHLTPYVGRTTAIRLGWAKAKSGRSYIVPEPPADAEITRAQQYLASNPDPFAEPTGTAEGTGVTAEDEKAALIARLRQQ